MNDLQKMHGSCKEFSKDLKTGNVTWEAHGTKTFRTKIDVFGFLTIFFDEVGLNFILEGYHPNLMLLNATTAKQAAHEALQLVKNEAQKLVDALSEPKEEMPKTKELYNKAEKHFWETMQEHKKFMAERENEIEDLLDKLNKEYSTYQKP